MSRDETMWAQTRARIAAVKARRQAREVKIRTDVEARAVARAELDRVRPGRSSGVGWPG